MIPNKIETLLSEAIDSINLMRWAIQDDRPGAANKYFENTILLINEARKENAKNNINPVAKFFGFIAGRGKS